jgi:hypothetical protein
MMRMIRFITLVDQIIGVRGRDTADGGLADPVALGLRIDQHIAIRSPCRMSRVSKIRAR